MTRTAAARTRTALTAAAPSGGLALAATPVTALAAEGPDAAVAATGVETATEDQAVTDHRPYVGAQAQQTYEVASAS